MGDDQGRAALQHVVESGLHERLVLVVEMTRCLVEDHHRRILQQHARNREPLLLSATQSVAALAHDRRVTIGQRLDGVVDSRRTAGFIEFGDGCLGSRITQVCFDALVEQMRVLRHDTDRGA